MSNLSENYKTMQNTLSDVNVALNKKLSSGGGQVTKFSQVADKIREIKLGHIYGFTVDNDNPDPFTRVEYTDEAIGLEPAKMENGVFNWGGWKDIFFNKENHVYRIRQDGTIVGQVKDDDYSQFLDGSDSAIDGTGHTDNFMSSIPTCWVYRGMEGNKRVVKIADYQVDDSYKAYAHTNESGEILDFIYWPTFRGSEVNGVMRSLSGKSLMESKTAEQECQAAQANGSRWYTFDWADYQLRNDLLCLMFKSTDLQTSLGTGYVALGTKAVLNSGTLTKKGAFWGDQSRASEVKAFHCEAPWGNQFIRIAGCVTDSNNKIKVKMTRPYNFDGTNYDTIQISINKDLNGFMSEGKETEYGLIPIDDTGSSETYECDEVSLRNINGYLFCGGRYAQELSSGPFFFNFSNKSSYANDIVGSALCLK